MPLPKCLVPPDRTNYTTVEGKTTVAIQLEGGASRYRADQLGATALVTVAWIVGGADYDYLKAFYRSAIALGSLPFLIDLVLDSQLPVEYTAFIVPDTFKLSSQMGNAYSLDATLEVVPLPIDSSADQIILARDG